MFDSQAALSPEPADPRSRADAVASLDRWLTEDPCPQAVAELATIDPLRLGDADRVRLVVALERQAAWLCGLQLPALVAVGDAYADTVTDAREVAQLRLAGADDADGAARTVSSIFGSDPDRWAAVELATALRISETTASMRLDLARALPRRLPLLDAALRVGRISFGHVRLVARETEPLSDELARTVDARLSRRYGKATPGQLRNAARHAVLAVDPVGARERHDAAARRRHLASRPEHDGMASLALFAAAPDVSVVTAAVTDIANRTAAAALAAGRFIPDRDSLLADSLVALARYWLDDTWPVPEPDPRQRPGRRRARAPGGRPPTRDEVDDLPVSVGKRGVRRRRGRDHTVVSVVIDLPTLLGLADHPARLDGYGAIPAELGRRIAADAAWRRMIVDPVSRRLLDRSPNTYRPGAQLAAYVRARDVVCAHPGCTRPALSAQLDHDNPFDLTDPDGGRTVATNLTPRCEIHHNAKTHLGWLTGTRRDGTRYTRSPLGFDYDLVPAEFLETG
jgi:Domain of unknown function (DUF222)